MYFFLTYKKFLDDIQSDFLSFLIMENPFFLRLFDYLCRRPDF